MKTITHYPGGEPDPTLRKPDVDTVIGVIAVALICICFGVLTIWAS